MPPATQCGDQFARLWEGRASGCRISALEPTDLRNDERENLQQDVQASKLIPHCPKHPSIDPMTTTQARHNELQGGRFIGRQSVSQDLRLGSRDVHLAPAKVCVACLEFSSNQSAKHVGRLSAGCCTSHCKTYARWTTRNHTFQRRCLRGYDFSRES